MSDIRNSGVMDISAFTKKFLQGFGQSASTEEKFKRIRWYEI